MKKLFTLAFTALFTLSMVTISAQSNRMAFVEEATQASCPPCATLNPALQSIMNANSETAIFMGYQVWWPGFDPMYLDNTSDVDARVGDYYNYGFAPQAILQGSFVGAEGAVDDVTQAELDAISSQMSEFDLSVSAVVVDGILQVSGDITSTMAADGDFKLRLMLVEDLITIGDAPGGTNGETEYHHVFKAFIGGPEGIDLEDAWTVGDTYSIDQTFNTLDLNIYHYDGLEVIAIIQNDADKFVHQAAKDHEIEISTSYSNSASGIAVEGLPSSMCIGEQTVSPEFVLANNGNAELTSATIAYSINGGAEQTMTWGGSLSTLATESVVLDPYTFIASAVNTINVTVSMPNGVADEDATDNDTATSDFIAAFAGASVTVEILTDNYGEETSWELLNESGVAVMTGGSYASATTYTDTYEVPAGESGCYEFKIYDTFGDGICCAYGIGHYEISDGDGTVLISGGEFGDDTSEELSVDGATGIEELDINNFSIYPNPTDDLTNISFEVVDSKVYGVEVIDITGRVVYTENLGQLNAGTQLVQIDAKQFESGMYLFNIVSGNQITSERVSIIK